MTDLATMTTNHGPDEASRQILDRAQKGDMTVLRDLQALLASQPALGPAMGNMAQHVERILVRHFAGANLLVQEAVMGELAALRTELAGPASSPLERLLVERVALSRLHVLGAEFQAAHAIDKPRSPFAVTDLSDTKRIDAAHRRFLMACKTLAVVRKLLPPTRVMTTSARCSTPILT